MSMFIVPAEIRAKSDAARPYIEVDLPHGTWHFIDGTPEDIKQGHADVMAFYDECEKQELEAWGLA